MKIMDTKDVLRVFANELNNRMDAKGVTYRHVALAARVPKENAYNYKSGTAFPELYTLVLIADYLECSVDELLGYRSIARGRSESNKPTNEKEFADHVRIQLINNMEMESVDVEELARRSGVSASTIDMYLSVHRWVPRVPEFLKLCDALGCSPSELLGY